MTVSVFIATSLDGFIARTNGDFDWLPSTVNEDYGYARFMSGIDALVMGRITFEKVLTFAKWPFSKPVFVLTSRGSEIPTPPGAIVEFLTGEPREIVALLRQRAFENIYLDGGVTIQRFLQAGAIDRMILSRAPVLLGAGIPLFGSLEQDVYFSHVTTRSWACGLVQSEYVVRR